MLSAPSSFSLSELAERFQLELRGDASNVIHGVGTLEKAGPHQITFLANPAYRPQLPSTRAGAVILSESDAENSPTACLLAEDPYLAYARIASLFNPVMGDEAGIHPSAVVDASVELGAGVSVSAHVVIENGCRIGAGCRIGPGSVIGRNSTLGNGCLLHANVTVLRGVTIGDRVIIHPGAVIGSDGFGIAFAGDHWEKVPQLGSVRIGDDCEIGACTTIDRGAIEDTVLEEDVRIDNLVQIAHNVHIGAHSAIAARAGIAGSTRIGRYCMLGGGCGVQGHIEIADRVTIGGRSTAYWSITEPGTTWSNILPAQPLKEWQRNLSRLRKLDDLARRVFRLEKLQSKSQDP